MKRPFRAASAALRLALGTVVSILPLSAYAADTIHFSIDAQDADKALTEFARQANTTLLFPFELAEKVKANAIEGDYTLQEGLTLLLEDTPLAVAIDGSGMLSIKPKPEPAPAIEVVAEVAPEPVDNEPVIERIAVVGTRSSPRSVVESPVPLDIIGSDSLSAQGASDVLSMLSAVVPSLNVNDQPINDATSLVRPANLRGMASDHTLVLLNGKRRHRSAVITFLGGGLSDGAQGPDISVLPASAMKQIEVLRDGAAAQYGSDAIAGVLNFVLDDSAEGGDVSLKVGGYGEGDGEMLQLQGSVGMGLGDKGFAHVTAEYRQQQPTSRSVQRDDATQLIADGNEFVADPAQVWGSLKVNQDVKVLANLGMPLNSRAEAYAFATLAYRDINGGFYFRNPHTRQGVFTRGEDENGDPLLLVADLDGVGRGISCPGVSIRDGNILDDPAYQLIANNSTDVGANCFAFNEWFPGGFTPTFGGTIKDGSAFVGVRGDTQTGWNIDLSASVGYSSVDYELDGTINPSLGPDSPLHFSPGGVAQVERTINLDVARLIQTTLAEPVSLAAGIEWRRETYHQHAGDPASYAAGPFAYDPVTGVSQGFSVGSNGFPGYQPQSAGHWSRSNWAVYTDVEIYLSADWQIGMAARMERFSDFGSTFDGKFSTRYAINDVLALRGSVSSGFKAPTVGQSNVINVTTAYGSNGLEDQATLPPTDAISHQLGATPLEPEESVNLSLGLVAYWDTSLYMTVDYFNIRLRDRISTTSAIPLTEADIASLQAIGRNDAGNYNAAKYFTNDFDTETQGVDVVLNYKFPTGDINNDLVIAYNWTDTKVVRLSQYPVLMDEDIVMRPNLTPQRIRMLEDNLPANRMTMTLTQSLASLSWFWRLNYYGSFYEDHLDASAGMDIESGSIWTVDAQLRWQFQPRWTATFGAKNLFDTKPDLNPYQGVVGAQYPPTSPSGINGGFYYLQLGYQF